jgi:hypothetical protein
MRPAQRRTAGCHTILAFDTLSSSPGLDSFDVQSSICNLTDPHHDLALDISASQIENYKLVQFVTG